MVKKQIPFSVLVEGDASRGTAIVDNLSQFDSDDPSKNRLSGDLDSDYKTGFELDNLQSDWEDGDTVRVKTVGIRSGFGSFNIDASKGVKKLRLTQTTADYAGASTSL